ncbi:LysR substrate-binding domain-containing protein [Pseudorhodoferax sp. Leaf274]|uniref:LysR substrate-binding domain-containing protein n=1 Tax=Pseudorhodoferax sp. Leaf274 TaxID=1736318 RepID=UPI001F38AA34|nr:LysR substrate-binding domain-containing protein [Pseudorhodoferax sp. Leaf274]
MARADLPRLDLLRSFAVAARTLSFTRAGEELALTQSAVSRQIQQMEEGLGVALFERRHRALALTAAGETMYRAVQDCLERLRDATASVRAVTRARQVAVTTTPGFASLWLIPRLARFSADHPLVDVRVSATNDLLNLERAGIDVAVRFCATAQGMGRPLFEETVLPVCAPRLLLDPARPLRRPADLVHHTLLVMEGHHGMAPMEDWAPWLQVMGLAGIRGTNQLRFSNYNDAVAAALAGQGVAIGRLPLAAALLHAGQLVAPFERSGHSQRGYFVAAGPQAGGNPDAQDFIAWLHAEAQRPL